MQQSTITRRVLAGIHLSAPVPAPGGEGFRLDDLKTIVSEPLAANLVPGVTALPGSYRATGRRCRPMRSSDSRQLAIIPSRRQP